MGSSSAKSSMTIAMLPVRRRSATGARLKMVVRTSPKPQRISTWLRRSAALRTWPPSRWTKREMPKLASARGRSAGTPTLIWSNALGVAWNRVLARCPNQPRRCRCPRRACRLAGLHGYLVGIGRGDWRDDGQVAGLFWGRAEQEEDCASQQQTRKSQVPTGMALALGQASAHWLKARLFALVPPSSGRLPSAYWHWPRAVGTP